MVKAITEGELAEMPFEDTQMFGRNHIRKTMGKGVFNEKEWQTIWFDNLFQVALSRFKWGNLPASIPPRAMEYILLTWGAGGMFVEEGGHLFAQAAFAGMQNMYYDPNEVTLTGGNGSVWYRHAQPWAIDGPGGLEAMDADCAVCWDNMARNPVVPKLKAFAKRLAQCEVVGDENIDAQQTPWVIAAPNEGKRNAGKLQQWLEGKRQYWKLNDTATDTLPYVLQTGAPFVADKVQQYKHIVLNDALTMLGIDNSNTDKRERVQTAEVLSNNDLISLERRTHLLCREEFCRHANALFGLNLTVEWDVEGVLANVTALLAAQNNGLASIMGGGEDVQ